MPLTAKSTGKDFELVPEGTWPAICYGVIDFGDQETEYEGKKNVKHQVRIVWEIADPDLKRDDGQPFSIGTTYTMSLSERANLRRDLKTWRGRDFTEAELEGFDLFTVLGVPCMITVIHQERRSGTGKYAKIEAVTPLPPQMKEFVGKPENDLVKFSLEDDDWRQVYEGLAEWIQNIVDARVGGAADDSPEPGEGPSGPHVALTNDDIPF